MICDSQLDWLSLPDCLWLKVFKNCQPMDLLIIKDVCHEWRRIAKDFSLTSHLDLSSKPIDINLLNQLISFSEINLKSIRIRGHWDRNPLNDQNIGLNAKTINNKLMKKLKNTCLRLNELCFEDINDLITCEHLPKNLIHLSINFCQINFHYFINPINAHNSETIRCLDISYFDLFDSIDCLILNNKFKSLKCLHMEGLIRVNDGGVSHFSRDFIKQLVVIDFEGTEVKDESLEHIFSNGSALQELYLGHTEMTGRIDYSKYVSNQLRHLCVINTRFDCQSIKTLFKYNSSLISVNCNEDIRVVIKSPVLKTQINTNEKTCFHFKNHKCDKLSKYL